MSRGASQWSPQVRHAQDNVVAASAYGGGGAAGKAASQLVLRSGAAGAGEQRQRVLGPADGANAVPRKGPSGALCPACSRPALEEEYVAVGPRGQRDVRNTADPVTSSASRWTFFHVQCMKDKGHARSHPTCTRPNGPCTDWHLRGKCKRGFDCGHCHFAHPELREKYPELPPGGILRRPQRRERLAMLKSAYEDEIKRYLEGDPSEQGVHAFLAGEIKLLSGSDVEGYMRSAVSQLHEADHQDAIQHWCDLIEAHPQLADLRQKLVKEAAAAGRESGPVELVRRFLERGEGFAEVMCHISDLARNGDNTVANLDDIMDFLMSAGDLVTLVRRLEELIDL